MREGPHDERSRPGFAAELFAAARDPRAMAAALPAFEGRPALRVHAALGPPAVCVPPEDDRVALALLARALDDLAARADGPAELPVATLWLGYDAARAACDPRYVDDPRPRGDRCPAAFLAPHEAACVRDGDTGAVVHRRGSSEALARLDAARAEAAARPSGRPRWTPRSDTPRRVFVSAVEGVRGRIADGEVYLVNVARRVDLAGDVSPDAIAHRVAASRAARAMLARGGGVTVGGMSMELALRWDRRRGIAWSAPIKGTRPRRDDPTRDALERAALAADPKERAENAMAVDVHRNDLARVAVPGGVSAPRLFEVESHAFVHHLVSHVRAEVPTELPAEEMLRAVLPVGSVTGAPKLAAMDVIAGVEPARRGLYTGVYGVAFADGSVELAVAIRTLVGDGISARYGVGGGIVWDSDPAREWVELAWKSRALR